MDFTETLLNTAKTSLKGEHARWASVVTQ